MIGQGKATIYATGGIAKKPFNISIIKTMLILIILCFIIVILHVHAKVAIEQDAEYEDGHLAAVEYNLHLKEENQQRGSATINAPFMILSQHLLKVKMTRLGVITAVRYYEAHINQGYDDPDEQLVIDDILRN